MSRHGNPDWGKPCAPVPDLPTEFEQQVEKLGLRPSDYEVSAQLKSWCRRNASTRYVPEYLLRLWGIKILDTRLRDQGPAVNT